MQKKVCKHEKIANIVLNVFLIVGHVNKKNGVGKIFWEGDISESSTFCTARTLREVRQKCLNALVILND